MSLRTPVLMLTGGGLMAGVGARTIAALAAEHRVITPAPVAAGSRSDASAPARVAAAIAELDAAEVARAHVVGLSFGGLIAQELAIRHPERVRSLALGATSAGGALYVAADERVRDFIRRLDQLPAEEGLWASVPCLYADRTRHRYARRIGADIAARLEHPLDPRLFRGERAVARAHDVAGPVAMIDAPTLILHGEEDQIVPLANAQHLAAAIPGARLITLRHGAHAFPTDVPQANRELVSFLRTLPTRRPRSPVRRTAPEGRA